MTTKNKIPKAAKVIILGVIFAFTLALNTNWTSAPTADGGGSVFITQAYAEDATTTSKEAFDPKALIQKVAEYSTYIHRFFTPLINFFAFNTGNFLGSDYIYAGAMGEMIHKIWVVSRNIVNIVFVLVLLFLALKEIFFVKEEGSGELKKRLMWLALMLVAVNFSWLATKVVLDTANVATNIVFALPSGVASAGIEKIMDQPCIVNKTGETAEGETEMKFKYSTNGSCMPAAIYAPVSSEKSKKYQYLSEEECNNQKINERYQGKTGSAFNTQGDTNPKPDEENKQYQDMTTYCWGNINFFNYNKNTSTVYLIYGMARIQNLIAASADESIVQLSVGILFSLLIQVAYTLALLALFIALIFRMAMLWLFVAFSPFLVLFLYLGGQSKGIGDIASKFSVNEFIRWAFVPTMVGAVFSVAFIMLSAGQSIMFKDPNFLTNASGGATLGMKLFKFKSLFVGMDVIQEFIWLVMVLVILWMGVFGILGKMPGVSKITEKINTWGKDGATFLAKMPYYAPITPMVNPKTGNFEFGKMSTLFKPIAGLPEMMKKYQQDTGGAELANAMEKAGKIKQNGADQKKILDLAANGKGSDIAGMYGLRNASNMMDQGAPAVSELLSASGFDSTQRDKILKCLEAEVEAGKKTAKAAEATAETVKEEAKKPDVNPAASAGPASPGISSGEGALSKGGAGISGGGKGTGSVAPSSKLIGDKK